MKLRAIFAFLTVLIGYGTVVSHAAASGSRIRMVKIQYNSPGTDTGSNASLNSEWVLLKNVGTGTGNLQGISIRDAANHVRTFGPYSMPPGKSVYVRTGKGTTSSTSIYWGSAAYIWNNTGDTAYLRASNGTLVQTCRWTSAGTGTKICTY